MRVKKNCLNSVLLEGTVKCIPALSNDGACIFMLTVSKNFPNDKVETFDIWVMAYAKTGKTCEAFLRAGSDVRIVGRLRDNLVVADHVEFTRTTGGTL